MAVVDSDELRETAEMQLRILSKRDQTTSVSSLASQMLEYPVEQYSSAPFKLDGYDKDTIRECWRCLMPSIHAHNGAGAGMSRRVVCCGRLSQNTGHMPSN